MYLNSDCIAENSRYNINDIVHAKERKNSPIAYTATVVQILEDKWIKVRWEWRGFSPGSTYIVKTTWITDDNAPLSRQDTDYNYDDNKHIDCHSISMNRVFARVPFNDENTP